MSSAGSEFEKRRNSHRAREQYLSPSLSLSLPLSPPLSLSLSLSLACSLTRTHTLLECKVNVYTQKNITSCKKCDLTRAKAKCTNKQICIYTYTCIYFETYVCA